MMTMRRDVMFKEKPKFVELIKSNPLGGTKASTVKDIIEDVFLVSVERGLNEEECSLLLHFFLKSSLNMNDRLKLLQNIVPEKKMSAAVIRPFLIWFMFNVKKYDISETTISKILQWIVGLLEYHLVDSEEIYNFYDDLYILLEYPTLIPYVAKLLCKLTKPDDVTGQTVATIYSSINDYSNKYILAVLNVFKGYKPHLMVEEVKKVDVVAVLKTVPQKMDTVMKVRAICSRAPQLPARASGVRDVSTRNFSYFNEESNKISSLIPLPTYNFEGMDKFQACYPNSVKEACRNFSRVPIPQNIMSLLHNDAGFFTITYQAVEEQMRFQNILLQTLQNALIYRNMDATTEDLEFMFRRIYFLETFMQQGIPSVSVFLSGYLLNWDGVDHRCSILKLIEWATFHSFTELGSNILRPLHIHFVTNNINMKKAIIHTLSCLIRNMFIDVSRVQQGIPFPFLKRGPRWTREPEATLGRLVSWVGDLITLGLGVERETSALLMEAVDFYEMLNDLEAGSNLPMFTVIPEGIVLQSLLCQNPIMIIRICRILLKYHQEFLPHLRIDHPRFYEQCKRKIGLTSNYAQQIIYFLQNGQVVVPKMENGMIIRDVSNESLAAGKESFCLTEHMCFASTYMSFESKKNGLDLLHPVDRRTSMELAAVHLRKIKDFINFFSPTADPGSLTMN